MLMSNYSKKREHFDIEEKGEEEQSKSTRTYFCNSPKLNNNLNSQKNDQIGSFYEMPKDENSIELEDVSLINDLLAKTSKHYIRLREDLIKIYGSIRLNNEFLFNISNVIACQVCGEDYINSSERNSAKLILESKGNIVNKKRQMKIDMIHAIGVNEL